LLGFDNSLLLFWALKQERVYSVREEGRPSESRKQSVMVARKEGNGRSRYKKSKTEPNMANLETTVNTYKINK
jgi:hypothetical protein